MLANQQDTNKQLGQMLTEVDEGLDVWGSALKQIEWHRSRTGYLHNDPISVVRDKIHKNIIINAEDAKLLLPIVNRNINKLGKHDYEMGEDESANLRQTAMEPLFKLRTKLLTILMDEKND